MGNFLKLIVPLLLISNQLWSQQNDCQIITDKKTEAGYLRSTKRVPVIDMPDVAFGIFMQNFSGTYKMLIDWSLNASRVKTKLNTDTPAKITFNLADGSIVSFNIIESSPGRGSMRSSWNTYELGGIIVIPPAQLQQLQASPIKSIALTFYNQPVETFDAIKAPDYFVKTIPCLGQ
ncbi:MAG: hypothetical protein SFW35_00900 [Chitinophagales bacterium]|nr:hypothetical protein [Chitinophagales bacterium]